MSSGVGPAHMYLVPLHICHATNGACDNYTTLYVPWSLAPGSWGGSRPQVFSSVVYLSRYM
jgi:hypothetical protein